MSQSEFSIIFMGTPEFATTILDSIYNAGIPVKAVVTAPDKPSGRGQKINESHVKQYAKEKGLNILQPTNLKDPGFVKQLEELNADLFVVVAFRMLPEAVWSLPPKGTINLHASLLPQYRGAAPINWAIINGEKITGVSTFFIEKEIDTGKIILQEKTAIGANENVGELYERLMHMGADVMLKTIEQIKNGGITPIDQSDISNVELKPAPKIFKQDCRMDFSKTALEAHNFCRGLSPYPGAWCILKNKATGESKSFKISDTLVSDITVKDSSTLDADKNGLLFPCSDYYIYIRSIQPEGKRRMNFKDFLAGNSISDYQIEQNKSQ